MRRNAIWSKLLVFNPPWALILMLPVLAAQHKCGSFFSSPSLLLFAFVKTVKSLVLFTQKAKCHPVPELWQICLQLKVLKEKKRKGFSCNLSRISDCFALWDAIQATKKAFNAPGRDLVHGCLMSHVDCESKRGKKQKQKQNTSLPQCATVTAWIPRFGFNLPSSFPACLISAGQYHVEIGQLELKPECKCKKRKSEKKKKHFHNLLRIISQCRLSSRMQFPLWINQSVSWWIPLFPTVNFSCLFPDASYQTSGKCIPSVSADTFFSSKWL